MDELHAIFVAEARELIADLERALLELENDEGNKECISAIFRSMHTLKGSSGMFGFEPMSTLTHQLETIYADIRDGKRSLSREILNATLGSVDHLKKLVEDAGLTDPALQAAHATILRQIETLSSQSADVESNAGESTTTNELPLVTYYVSFHPRADILKNGTNTLYLADDVLALGHGISIPYFADLPTLEAMTPALSYTGFEIVVATSKSETDIREVFMFVEAEANLTIQIIEKGDLLADESTVSNLLSLSKGTSPLGLRAVESVLIRDTGRVTPVTESTKGRTISSVRVPSDRLDEFMNLVSELVTTQASLTLYGSKADSPELTEIAENVEKITRRLRDNAFSMSLVPIESLVIRFQRLIRDLSRELNKQIVFKAEGTDTEIDKAIVEKLTDPIVHLMRNAAGHGIESPEERVKKGKPAQGQVTLRSYYSGANVIIEISDDGAGINIEKVRKKAIAKGLLDPNTETSEQEILNMIFLPGFSTAEKVTDVSGRGVGMDVLRKNIADLQGEVSLHTVAGEGTTFTIRLPLTLSIIDGLLVRIGETDFILPLAAVDKCYEVDTKYLEQAYNTRIALDGELIPFLLLRREFNVKTESPDRSQAIKITYDGTKISLVVDKILGEYQAVLKPLGHLYRHQDEFSGATILGDGSVALVIDPHKLSRKLITSQSRKQQVYEQQY